MGGGVARSARRGHRQDGLSPDVVRAAGGVLVRWGRRGTWETVVVHRPKRRDWSLPKGKLDPGESWELGALREVEEETGYQCRLGRFVGYTEYVDRRRRPKIVAYWVMEVIGGVFTPNAEVDELRWLELDDAAELLSYGRDRDLLASFDEPVLAGSA